MSGLDKYQADQVETVAWEVRQGLWFVCVADRRFYVGHTEQTIVDGVFPAQPGDAELMEDLTVTGCVLEGRDAGLRWTEGAAELVEMRHLVLSTTGWDLVVSLTERDH